MTKEFLVGKSTVWKDLHERLKDIDPELYTEVQRRLNQKAKLATYYMNQQNKLNRFNKLNIK